MPSDGVLLLISLGGLSVIVFIILYVAGFFRSTRVVNATPDANAEDEVLKAGGRRATGGLAALRKRKEKKNARGSEQEQVEEAPGAAAAAPAPAQAEGEEGQQDIIEPRAMTKKELQKEMKRREREELRQFEEQRREEQRKRAEEKEEVLIVDGCCGWKSVAPTNTCGFRVQAFQKKREEEARLEQEQEEAARRLEEEKAKKEQEEFDTWKNMFSIEEQGAKADTDSEESQMLLQQFVDYIKAKKVVVLEDLGSAFNLPTQDAIQRVETLQESNRITGIIDDRGKFIYITEEEMDKVAKFIQRKGRLGLTELSKECNKLIRLDGEKESTTSAVDWLNEVEEQPEVAA
ncbi:hypothetical protein Poli38472_000840 [Pythium oligandrum]|uniref:DDRGK domain-containing protein 1 n=1 Tax=Pythium oligandrum TaxID=41045 RepID=A0A8K1CD39_PYTOL|nr:hypothetical protein Poli38472_000840 [Pythium oligandrum]|eukprot:TMW60798.1 hypothetical protein Poli38472_000840 [Pythium oligandrum]